MELNRISIALRWSRWGHSNLVSSFFLVFRQGFKKWYAFLPRSLHSYLLPSSRRFQPSGWTGHHLCRRWLQLAHDAEAWQQDPVQEVRALSAVYLRSGPPFAFRYCESQSYYYILCFFFNCFFSPFHPNTRVLLSRLYRIDWYSRLGWQVDR